MGPRGRVLAGVLVVAVVIAAVVIGVLVSGGDGDEGPAGPVAAVQDDHLPVDSVDTIPARIDAIAATGTTTTRVDLFWSDIAPREPERPRDPADPAYDWSRADLIMRGLAEKRITPIISVYNTPNWVAAPLDPALPVNPSLPSADAFADFMAAVARRYGGAFTPGGQSDPLPRVDRLEIWNEPNLPLYLAPQTEGGTRVALERYSEMVKAAYPAIKQANPEAIVIAGVAGPRSSSSDTGIGALDWLRGLRERRIPLDAYSQHIYPALPPTADSEVVPTWASVGRLLQELDGFTPGLPLYVTEAGYTTAATRFRDARSAVSEDDQAQYLTQIWELPQVQTDRIKAIVWFNLEDNRDWPAGLMREDLEPKPSYEAFTRIVERQDGARLG